ncbi:MAG: 6-carboxytetrahydropterin synthase [Planctomycetota bacterium]
MFRLCREVRFNLDPCPDDDWIVYGENSFGGKPPALGGKRPKRGGGFRLRHYLMLRATLTGAELPKYGYLRNIKEVDVALRDRSLPIIAQFVRENTFGGGCGVLRAVFDDVRDIFPDTPVTDMELVLSPTCRLSIDRETPTMVKLTQAFEFAAGHRLHNPDLSHEENLKMFGKCNNPHIHGHNYQVEVTVAGEPDENGLVMDLNDLERIVGQTIIDEFDHKNLNVEVEEFQTLNPSVENISKVVYERLTAVLPKLHKVRVWETPKTWCEYGG